MNFLPPKKGGACTAHAPIPKLSTGLTQHNSDSVFPQVRCCVVCGCIVTNFNLGGHDAPSAFRGHLWCLRCADQRPLQ